MRISRFNMGRESVILDLAAASSSLIFASFAFCAFWNHLDKLYTCKSHDPLSSVHVYLLLSSIGLPYLNRRKEGQFTTVT